MKALGMEGHFNGPDVATTVLAGARWFEKEGPLTAVTHVVCIFCTLSSDF